MACSAKRSGAEEMCVTSRPRHFTAAVLRLLFLPLPWELLESPHIVSAKHELPSHSREENVPWRVAQTPIRI